MIIVVGSLNMDLVVEVDHHPSPGETTLGSNYTLQLGGKGANQAVAVARLGEPVYMVGKVGTDGFGKAILESLERERVEVCRVGRGQGPSGVAFVVVEGGGENCIVVAPGANGELSPDNLDVGVFVGADTLLVQMEIQGEVVRKAVDLASDAGCRVLVNASPALEKDLLDLAKVDLLLVNRVEAKPFCGYIPHSVEEALAAVAEIGSMGPATVLTLGEKGCVWSKDGVVGHVAPFPVRAVDTTGAGDTFAGTLATALSWGYDWETALRLASAAGALATLDIGAQASMPSWPAVAHLAGADAAHREEPLKNLGG